MRATPRFFVKRFGHSAEFFLAVLIQRIQGSNRDASDVAEYPDVDLAYRKIPGGKAVFVHKDGTAY